MLVRLGLTWDIYIFLSFSSLNFARFGIAMKDGTWDKEDDIFRIYSEERRADRRCSAPTGAVRLQPELFGFGRISSVSNLPSGIKARFFPLSCGGVAAQRLLSLQQLSQYSYPRLKSVAFPSH